MKVNVTLRYLQKTVVEINTTEEIENGCTLDELTTGVIRAHEKETGINFTGAHIAVILNGRLTSGDKVLNDGDIIKIMPVAAGG